MGDKSPMSHGYDYPHGTSGTDLLGPNMYYCGPGRYLSTAGNAKPGKAYKSGKFGSRGQGAVGASTGPHASMKY